MYRAARQLSETIGNQPLVQVWFDGQACHRCNATIVRLPVCPSARQPAPPLSLLELPAWLIQKGNFQKIQIVFADRRAAFPALPVSGDEQAAGRYDQ